MCLHFPASDTVWFDGWVGPIWCGLCESCYLEKNPNNAPDATNDAPVCRSFAPQKLSSSYEPSSGTLDLVHLPAPEGALSLVGSEDEVEVWLGSDAGEWRFELRAGASKITISPVDLQIRLPLYDLYLLTRTGALALSYQQHSIPRNLGTYAEVRAVTSTSGSGHILVLELRWVAAAALQPDPYAGPVSASSLPGRLVSVLSAVFGHLPKTGSAAVAASEGGDKDPQYDSESLFEALASACPPPVEPSENCSALATSLTAAGLKSTLYPFQLAALEWMKARECSDEHAATQEWRKPLWYEVADMNQEEFFINPFNGALWRQPTSDLPCVGSKRRHNNSSTTSGSSSVAKKAKQSINGSAGGLFMNKAADGKIEPSKSLTVQLDAPEESLDEPSAARVTPPWAVDANDCDAIEGKGGILADESKLIFDNISLKSSITF